MSTGKTTETTLDGSPMASYKPDPNKPQTWEVSRCVAKNRRARSRRTPSRRFLLGLLVSLGVYPKRGCRQIRIVPMIAREAPMAFEKGIPMPLCFPDLIEKQIGTPSLKLKRIDS